MNKIRTVILSVTTLILLGCASEPETFPEIQEARLSVQAVSIDPLVQQHASKHILNAKQALDQAEQSVEKDEDIESARHYAYLASQHAKVAKEQTTEAILRQKIKDSEAKRNEILLSLRTNEARTAKQQAQLNATEALIATQNANKREAENKQLQQRLDSANEEVKKIGNELAGLKSKQTERGLVLTLNQVLFETDKADLKPGAEKTLNRVAKFLEQNSNRRLLIEGHTDATGSAEYNRTLSSQRAQAVATFLTNSGISESRIRSKGLGEEFPVATNKTVSGRQENRRVEIIISNDDDSFPAEGEQ